MIRTVGYRHQTQMRHTTLYVPFLFLQFFILLTLSFAERDRLGPAHHCGEEYEAGEALLAVDHGALPRFSPFLAAD